MRNLELIFIKILILMLLSVQISISSENVKKPEEYWMKVFSDDRNVGFSHLKIIENENILELVEESVLSIEVMGKDNKIKTTSIYRLVDDKISSFNYLYESNSSKNQINGVAENGSILITSKSVSGSMSLKISHKDDFVIPPLLTKWLSKRDLSEGSSYQFYFFDPLILATGLEVSKLKTTVSIKGPESIKINNNIGEVTKAEIEYLGSKHIIWFDDKGVMVKEIFPPNFVSYISDEEDVKSSKISSFDLIDEVSIKTEKTLSRPRNTKFLEVKIKGLSQLETLDFNDGYRQYLDGDILKIHTNKLDNIEPYNIPYSGDIDSEFLLNSSLIQSDNPLMHKKAVDIVKNEKNSYEVVKLLNDWVYKEINKKPKLTIPSALDVLMTKEGDCNEHTVLFASLARTLGVPTKVILGIVYQDGKFFYHAWNEVFLGEWVALDSTYGQMPADSTHIKIIEGDISRSSEIMQIVGKLELDILSYY